MTAWRAFRTALQFVAGCLIAISFGVLILIQGTAMTAFLIAGSPLAWALRMDMRRYWRHDAWIFWIELTSTDRETT